MIRAVAGASQGATIAYASPFSRGSRAASGTVTADAGGGRSASAIVAASVPVSASTGGTSGGGALLATLGNAIGGFLQRLADLFTGGREPAHPVQPANPFQPVPPPAGGPAQPAVPAQPRPATPLPAAPPPRSEPIPPGVPDWDGPYGFGPHSFLLEPTGSGPNGSYRYNSLQFARKEAAEKAASLLGGKVITVEYDGLFRLHVPYYHIQVGKAVLNAGLVINTFIRNPPEVAMKMLRTEIDAENASRV